jgi:cell division protein FtsW
MGVNLALLPTTGVTLPFFSYGRSSLLVSLIAVGLLMNIARHAGRRTE